MNPLSRLPRMLSVEETAQLLNVSTKTIHRWRLSGMLAAHKLGRQVRIKEDELEAVIRSRREGGRR